MTSKNRVTVNLAEDEAAQLAALAKKAKLSKAWLARHAICSWLESAKKIEDEHELPLPFRAGRKGSL
ncbi:MAG: ribbon-helix-helix protein, CopG family [Novosphingobium sp.]|uniref:ribbon-helix-helix protein, CopG family n=1 Tax=Novosphingobium sp. TaxID=1874826 RepID=UPI003B9C7DDE